MRKALLFIFLLPVIGFAQLGYTETGEASYYADKFNGKLTASGERFDNNSLTAAHRVLPFGAKVLVTEVATGRTVVVRINDRGPFKRGRIIDLSKAAAKAIGLTEKGVAAVSIEVVEVPGGDEETPPAPQPAASPKPAAAAPTTKPAPTPETRPTPPSTSTPTPAPTQKPSATTAETPFAPGGTYNLWGKRVQYDGFCLQLTALGDLEKAKAHAARVKDAGLPTVYIRVQKQGTGTLYKVVQGVYKTEEEARAAIPQLKAKGFACFLSHYRQ